MPKPLSQPLKEQRAPPFFLNKSLPPSGMEHSTFNNFSNDNFITAKYNFFSCCLDWSDRFRCYFKSCFSLAWNCTLIILKDLPWRWVLCFSSPFHNFVKCKIFLVSCDSMLVLNPSVCVWPVLSSSNFTWYLFIMLYKLALTFKSVNETLVCDHSNESYWAVRSWYCLLCCTRGF